MQGNSRAETEIVDSERHLLGAFGQRLTGLRVERGLSQQEIARRLGTTAFLVSKYERGQNNPKVSTLLRLRRVFSASLDYLLAGDGAHDIQDSRLLEVLQAADRLPRRLRDLLASTFAILTEQAQRWAEEERDLTSSKER